MSSHIEMQTVGRGAVMLWTGPLCSPGLEALRPPMAQTGGESYRPASGLVVVRSAYCPECPHCQGEAAKRVASAPPATPMVTLRRGYVGLDGRWVSFDGPRRGQP